MYFSNYSNLVVKMVIHSTFSLPLLMVINEQFSNPMKLQICVKFTHNQISNYGCLQKFLQLHIKLISTKTSMKTNKIKQVMRKLNHNSLKNSTQCNTSYMPQSHPTKTQNHLNTSTSCNLSPRKNQKLATSQSTTYVVSDSINKQ
jgi:hypothetical protein